MPRTPLDVACPKCGEPITRVCRTLTTQKPTDTHQARWIAAFPDWPVAAPLRFGSDAACEWCGRAIDRDEQGRWYAVKGAERGYDPLVCDAVADRDDTDHAPTPKGSSS